MTPYEQNRCLALAVIDPDGASPNIANALMDAYNSHHESDDGPWRMGPDAYYDLLESYRIGHRQLRTWISEKEAGDTVTLTRKGKALFDMIASIPWPTNASSPGTQS